MCRLAAATVIVLLGATLINWLRGGSTFHIAKAVTVHTQQSTSFDFPYQAPQQLFLGVFAQLCR